MNPDFLELTIERIVHNGLGLARSQGKVIFIPAVAPDERVVCQIEDEQKNYAYARLVQVLEPSPHRIIPECPYFPLCGGCQLAHIDYPYQLQLKREILAEALKRITKLNLPDIEAPVASVSIFGYRLRLRFHIQNQKIGFQAQKKKEFIQIEDCLLAREEIQEAIPALKNLIQRPSLSQAREIEVDFNPESSEVLARLFPSDKVFIYRNQEFVQSSLARKDLLRLLSFAQPNFEQNLNLRKLLSLLAQNLKARTGLELFSGAGNLSFELAKILEKLVSVEINQSAIELAEIRKAELGFNNIQLLAQSSESYLNYALKKGLSYDLIILDPPRAGAKKEIEKIISIKPKAIIYASCEPTTLARDIKKLLSAGYQLEKIIPLDMFPQTFHIESVSLLKKS